MGFWTFLAIIVICETILQISEKKKCKSNIDCTECIHGTSTGHGICAECDGSYFENKSEV